MTGTRVRQQPTDQIRAVFICQAVDPDDPVLATTVRWIEALASKRGVDHVTVLALRTGRYDLPDNVDLYRFGRSNRPATLGAFYRAVARSLRRRPDFFFVHQGGPYPLLLLPLKLLKGIPIIQWKAHSVISRIMSFYARWCDDLIFTAARAAFPMDLPKIRVVGHGIDTEVFRIEDRRPLGDLIAVCRIAPTKHVDQMIKAVVEANHMHGSGYRLDVYGPTLTGDESYAAGVENLIDRLQARDWVTLHGPVPQDHLPGLLNGHRACLNFTTGAIDKSAVEAMACGLPVISTNDSVAEVMPPDLRSILIAHEQSTKLQATTIHELLRRSDGDVAELGQRMRAVAVSEHSIDRLFDRILEEIRTSLWDRD
jgi:glycosyltransferase involved in cell wall biosynthesis